MTVLDLKNKAQSMPILVTPQEYAEVMLDLSTNYKAHLDAIKCPPSVLEAVIKDYLEVLVGHPIQILTIPTLKAASDGTA